MSALAVTEITAACKRDYKPARRRQSRSIVLSEGNRRRFPLTLNRSLHREVLNALYFVDTLLIATTSRTTISAPITVQIHIPPPIHPYAWFIVGPNSLPKLRSSLDLAAATVVALRRSRGLVEILLRTKVEFLFALGTAEVIGLPFMLGSSSGSSAFYVHATDRIFHSCCAIHYDLP